MGRVPAEVSSDLPGLRAKRLADVVVGLPLALIALPVVIVLALGSAVTFRAWPLFVQKRVGYRRREFPFIKLRTLPPTTPTTIDKEALKQFPVPRFARLLRSTHLDELPQLFLVPFGCMTLIGPRPEMVEIVDRYPNDFATLRTSVRPGCTGLWQISVASAGMIYEAPQYDEFYVQNVGVLLDTWILARTIACFLPRIRHSVTLQKVPAWTRRGVKHPQRGRVDPNEDVAEPESVLA